MRWNLLSPRLLLRCEGAATLVVATALYGARGGAWPLFLVLLLVPDLSALGYLVNSVTGAAWYNAAHTYLVPVALGAVGLAGGHAAVLLVALIWGAHIGLDRALGYGLKYPAGFTATHLGGATVSAQQPLGRRPEAQETAA